MHPYLFDFVVFGNHLRPPTYGVLLAIAFSSGYFLALRRSFILKEDPKHIENTFLIVIFSSIIGSRFFHVLFEEPEYYFANPQKILFVWEGGYTFYGALLSVWLFTFLYLKRKKLSFLNWGDIATPSTAFGLFLGRLGCFFAGCCWGNPTEKPWGIIFSHPDSFTSNHTTRLHPTQIYESFLGLFIFFYSEWRFKNRKYEGQIFFEGTVIYTIGRFIIEMYRGDSYRGFLFNGIISYSQMISLIILPFCFVGMFLYSRKATD